MLKAVSSSSYYVLGNFNGTDKLLNGEVEVKRRLRKKGSYILQLVMRNKSTVPLILYSAVVCEFKLPKQSLISVLEHGWMQCSPSRFKPVSKPTVRNKLFLRRNHNPHSFERRYGFIPKSIVSEWFTVLRYNKTAVLIGAVTTSKQFSQAFIKDYGEEILIRFTCQFDGITLRPGDSASTEKIAIIEGDEPNILDDFTSLLVSNMNVHVKNTYSALCCSYYWRGNYVSEGIIDKELDRLTRLNLHLDYIQIDAGYCKYWGDWADNHERFPHGLKKIADEISKRGFKPGIWLAPFVASPNSKLIKQHPDWFLRYKNKIPESRASSPVDSLIPGLGFRPIDPTNTEFLVYLKSVLEYFVEAGFVMYKLDFLYPVCLYDNYAKKSTRAEALHSGLEFIRRVVGKNSLIVTGISPLSPLVGIADSARIGIDCLNPYVKLPILRSIINDSLLSANLNNNNIRKFMNKKIWINDSDCLMFSNDSGLNPLLRKRHQDLVLEGFPLWLGDSIARLNDDELTELKRFVNKYKKSKQLAMTRILGR